MFNFFAGAKRKEKGGDERDVDSSCPLVKEPYTMHLTLHVQGKWEPTATCIDFCQGSWFLPSNKGYWNIRTPFSTCHGWGLRKWMLCPFKSTNSCNSILFSPKTAYIPQRWQPECPVEQKMPLCALSARQQKQHHCWWLCSCLLC